MAAVTMAIPAIAQDAAGDDGLLDLTLPDLSAPADAAGGYVDPQIKNREQCLDHPGRPAWVMVQPEGMEWRRDLMLAYGTLQIRQRVVETGECSCDHRYPDWETFRQALEELVAPFEQVRLADMPQAQQDDLYRLERSLRRPASKIGFEYGKACQGAR
ncbi:hypothetical protein [Jannaschia aquimarina]|uniref:hypothetical protein n=1 Tax=Jannaschia aquimarina TaxID=935700 RepID=UPI001269C26A|nr:hypothetical protein [Jannaschia aquimarina]